MDELRFISWIVCVKLSLNAVLCVLKINNTFFRLVLHVTRVTKCILFLWYVGLTFDTLENSCHMFWGVWDGILWETVMKWNKNIIWIESISLSAPEVHVNWHMTTSGTDRDKIVATATFLFQYANYKTPNRTATWQSKKPFTNKE